MSAALIYICVTNKYTDSQINIVTKIGLLIVTHPDTVSLSLANRAR